MRQLMSIHGVNAINVSEPLQRQLMMEGSKPYYAQSVTIVTDDGSKVEITLFGDNVNAMLTTNVKG